VFEGPQALDLHPDGVARLQVLRRLERLADAARRAGEDDRAGLERAGLADELDQLARLEDQVARAAVLAQLAVDVRREAQVAGVDLVGRRDPGSPGAGGVEALGA
jgi:hypothetical protein